MFLTFDNISHYNRNMFFFKEVLFCLVVLFLVFGFWFFLHRVGALLILNLYSYFEKDPKNGMNAVFKCRSSI